MLVKVIQCTGPMRWSQNHIGEIIDVYESYMKDYYYVYKEDNYVLYKDCITMDVVRGELIDKILF
jgi:hypothetical protein